MSLGDNLFDPP